MSKKNSVARQQLEMLYGVRDMLTGIESNSLTYHHCLVKKEHGGTNTISNGALLIHKTHNWLTNTEYSDRERYDLINDCLDLYKKCIDYGNIDLIIQYENEVMPKARHLILKR